MVVLDPASLELPQIILGECIGKSLVPATGDKAGRPVIQWVVNIWAPDIARNERFNIRSARALGELSLYGESILLGTEDLLTDKVIAKSRLGYSHLSYRQWNRLGKDIL